MKTTKLSRASSDLNSKQVGVAVVPACESIKQIVEGAIEEHGDAAVSPLCDYLFALTDDLERRETAAF